MTLVGSSEAAREIAAALRLPPQTFDMTFRMAAGEPATVEAKIRVDSESGWRLAEVLKRYRLVVEEDEG